MHWLTRWFGALLLSLFLACGAQAQVTFQQVAQGGFATSSSSFTVTFSSGISAGSIIVVIAEWPNAIATATISDGSSDTVTNSALGTAGDGNSISVEIEAFFAPTAGTTTVTATYSAAAAWGVLYAYEVSGLTSASFDKTATATNGGTTTSCSSGTTATLAQATEPAVGLCSGYGTLSSGAGWTGDTEFNEAGFHGIGMHQVTSSTTGIAATGSEGAADLLTGYVATIKGTISGGGPTCPMTRTLMGVGC